ncbi:MAG: radical SAM protein, partial [Promethearchaeota archaeon]
CKLWKCEDPKQKLNLHDKINFLKEMIKWLENQNEDYRNLFFVILTGGEPFLYPEQVFEIVKFCKNNEIDSYINTNGSLISTILRKILNSGLTAITISIDSNHSEIHDNLRGMPGLFNHLIKIIKYMKHLKDKKIYPIKLCVQSILGAWNINSLSEHINFFENLGLDGIIFQPIQYPFGLYIPSNWYKNFDEFPILNKDIMKNIDFLIKSNYDGFLMNSKEEMEMWKAYFTNPEYLLDYINSCKAYEQNLILDVSGNVKFCFNREIEPKNMIGNILTNSLDEIWNGKTAIAEKLKMKTCKRACGIMACHIDTNLRKK